MMPILHKTYRVSKKNNNNKHKNDIFLEILHCQTNTKFSMLPKKKKKHIHTIGNGTYVSSYTSAQMLYLVGWVMLVECSFRLNFS